MLMKNSYEIERKYFVETPDFSKLCLKSRKEIVQTYLKRDDKGLQRRVRKITESDKVFYTYTEKEFLSALIRKEKEYEITENEYESLLMQADEKLVPVIKVRYDFIYENQLFELDVYSFNDIERIDMSQYKFFVFPGSFKIDKHRMDVLKKYIFKDGKTSLFLYAPAIINEHSLDVQNVKNFIGIDYATKGVNFSNKGDYNIAYVHNYEDFNVDVARDLAKKSGVRMLSESGDVVYANEKLLSIHSSKGGKRLVKLPFKCSKVTELYTKKVVGYNCDEIEITISKPDTLLFELEK